MNGLRAKKIDAKNMKLTGIDWVTAACLLEVPNILPLARSGSARDRLFQKLSTTDPTLNEDWQQLITPELETLFAQAGEILAKDIEPLAGKTKSLKPRSLTIPLNHCNAWMSALNQSRLILGAQHNVAEKDMDEREFGDPNNPRQQAVLRVHVLGYVLQLFVELAAGEA